jgi:hypothetical protein
MNVYTIYCEDPESTDEIDFVSEDIYGDQCFKAVVHICLRRAAKAAWESYSYQRKINDIELGKSKFPFSFTMGDLVSSVFFIAEMKKIGLHRLNSTATTNLFSPSEIIRVLPKDCLYDKELRPWEGYTSDEQLDLQEEIREIIGKVEYPV